MEIKREEFFEMYKFEEYIKSKCKYVDSVLCDIIYFNHDPHTYLIWHETLMLDKERMDWFLEGFNAMLGTDFKFMD